ncbi:BTAD domain-containing putative transcriptional regulator [uncultured Nocardioides sp.]|uniref:BTAD domain-containing putative transcriptional regulator n=1 Tax=uncultured Nocardioides sp. TaxID=198441 RepID=UPI0026059BEB|nr:BTAD domain-containing putative transcriptional regulator [uncultured Nocardioides sp.]
MVEAVGLRISLLGELTASYDGTPLDLGGRRQRAVLAVLLLARGEVVPAERLIDAVWDENPPSDAVSALQSYVSHLRRRLQPDTPARDRSGVILREGPGYAVRQPPGTVDAWRFEELLARAGDPTRPHDVVAVLREALDLWKGPALADYTDESWAAPEIARLTELRAVAREQLLAARLETDEPALLVPELEALVGEEPLREERWRLLVLALYRAHRQADALAALRRARTTLAEELGVDPGPALRELEAEVLAQSPSLVQQRPRADASRARPTTAPTAEGDRLVERDRELATLTRALDAVAEGRHGLVLIKGSAGIGKTRLLGEVRRLARARSVQVLAARGSQLESAFAFGVVRQLFEPAIADPVRRDDLLHGAATGARGVFDFAEGDKADGFAVLHGLYWLTVNLTADGPLVLTVDDAQWCDAASLRFLAYVARRLEAVPVLVVATVRTTGEEPHEDALLAELELEPNAEVLRPGALSVAATAELVQHSLEAHPADLFTTACHQTTSGNPLLLNQLLRALAADGVPPDAAHADRVVALGSRAISGTVLVRLRRLPDDVVEVARAGAVLGDGAALPVVAALAGQPEGRTAEALADLARLEIVGDEHPVAFVHALVRDAVYHSLPAAERGLWHERAAAALWAAHESDEQVAAHLLLAPARGDEDVVALLRAAARAALDRGSSESAVTYLRRALTEPPAGTCRPELLVELGQLEATLDGVAGVEHLVEAYHLHEDPRARAEIAIAAAATQIFASPPGVATAFAREAEAALPDELTDELSDQRQSLIALQRVSGFMHSLEAGWRTPAPEPEGPGPGAQMLAATIALEEALDGADRERAVDMARFALEGDRLLTVDDGLFWINAAAVKTLADDDLGSFWDRARAVGRSRGSLFTMLSISLWEGFWRWRRGELHEALACLRDGLEQDRMWGGTGVGEPFALGFQILCHLDRGDVAAARRSADSISGGPLVGESGRVFQQALAQLLVVEGRGEEALVVVAETPVGIAITNPAWNPWRSITAAALHGLGRTAEAVEVAEEEVALLRRWGAPSYLGKGLYLLAQLRGSDGLDELRESVRLLESSPAAVDCARARCTLGNRPEVPDEEAIELLLAADRAARQRGAQRVRDLARAGLQRRGYAAESVGDEVLPLSATERQIIDLSAAGVEVREVAQRLFLTPGTVLAVLDEVGSGHPGAGSAFPQGSGVMMREVQDRRLS